ILFPAGLARARSRIRSNFLYPAKRFEPVSEPTVRGRAALRPLPLGHVSQRRPGGEGGIGRACLCLARHLDGVARQIDRSLFRQAAGGGSIEGARPPTFSPGGPTTLPESKGRTRRASAGPPPHPRPPPGLAGRQGTKDGAPH